MTDTSLPPPFTPVAPEPPAGLDRQASRDTAADGVAWFYEGPGQAQIGPVTVADLQALAKSGTITPGTRVWTAALGPTWIPLGETDLLRGAGPPPIRGVGSAATAKTFSADQAMAWLLAIHPITTGIVASLIPTYATSIYLTMFFGGYFGLLLFDRTNIRKAGVEPQPIQMTILTMAAAFIAVFAVIPIYLRWRAKAFHQSFAAFYASIAVFVLVAAFAIVGTFE